MKFVLRSLAHAVVSQLHPRMLWLAIWPLLIALAIWGVIGWVFHESLMQSIYAFLFGMSWVRSVESAFDAVGLAPLMDVMVPLIYVMGIAALSIMTAIVILGTVAMPAVVEHVSRRHYATIARRGRASLVGSTVNAVAATLIAALGWLLTWPLWLILPLAVLVPWFWWGWLGARILRYDALAQHASNEERRLLIARYRSEFLWLGIVCAAMNFVPPLFFVAPIFTGLAFTHFGLQVLAQMREEEAVARTRAAATATTVDLASEVPVLQAPAFEKGDQN